MTKKRHEFKPISQQNREQRILALLLGESGTGKSTFVAGLPTPIAVADSDGRVVEIAALVSDGQIYAQENLDEATDIETVLDWFDAAIPAIKPKSLVWDTITPVLAPVIAHAMAMSELTPDERVARGEPRNKASLWIPKSTMMRQIRSIQNHGTHVVWTAHYDIGRDEKGKVTTKRSIPKTEFDMFAKNLNMRIKTLKHQGRYGVKIEYARARPTADFPVLWDEPGNMFKGMWDRILATIYDDPIPETEAVDWQQLGHDKPFSQDKDLFEERALQQIRERFVEHDGHRFFAYGQEKFGTDPAEEVIKKDGSPGVNSALIHVRKSYEKIKKGDVPGYKMPDAGKWTWGSFTEALKRYTDDKIEAKIEAYEEKKKTPEEPAPVDDKIEEPEVEVAETVNPDIIDF